MSLPKWIKDKKAVTNMECEDGDSFKYTVTRSLHPVEKKVSTVSGTLVEQSENLDWSSPIVPEFEKNNGIGINLIELSDDRIVALKVAGWTYPKVVTLFFYGARYYVVRNISRLWSGQINRSRRSRIFCDRCLLSFGGKVGFDKHILICRTGINKGMDSSEVSYEGCREKTDFPFEVSLKKYEENMDLYSKTIKRLQGHEHHLCSVLGLYRLEL
jgi:hypothetical protein